MESTLEVHLLGSLQLAWGGSPLKLLHPPRLRYLLAYLILHRTAPQPRQSLAFLLFPDSSEAQARTNLRNLLHLLHEALPEAEQFLASDTQSLQWRPEARFTLDVEDFERAYHSATTIAEWQQAVGLYSGDLLAGCYDDWILPERERLRQEFVDALEQLVACHERTQNFPAARQVAQRLLSCDPLREETYRRLMRLAALSGDRAGVVSFYNQCVQVLERELAVEPGPETQSAYREFLQLLAAPQIENRELAGAKAKHNLPLQLTRLIGRASDVRQVKALVVTNRLVTLVGAGGVGKTRLALAAAEELCADFPDGVWFIDLAPLSDEAQILQAIASVLRIRKLAAAEQLDAFAEFLRTKHVMLVLDNCEHLIPSVGQIAARLLQTDGNLHILATSRENLGISGEVIRRVASLSVPAEKELESIGDTADAEQFGALVELSSIELFRDQAARVLPTFEVTRANVRAVGQICRRVDGIPLAVQLAAPWVKLLSVEQIAKNLNDSFHLLLNGSRAALPRHQTMHATMDWSYRLLSDKEQRFLRRVSVFAGGFTLEAVEFVVPQDDIAPDKVLHLLSSLQDKSLVEVEQQPGAARYYLLETVRQYARTKLSEVDELSRLSEDHLRYFAKLAEQADASMTKRDQMQWLGTLEREHDNLRAALEASQTLKNGNLDGLGLAAALVEFWTRHSYLSEGQYWLEAACTNYPAPSLMRAKVLSGLGTLKYMQGHLDDAAKHHAEALALYRRFDHRPGIISSLSNLGVQVYKQNKYPEAKLFFQQSLTLARQDENNFGIQRALNGLGGCALNEGRFSRAQALFEQALHLAQHEDDQREVIFLYMQLGEVARLAGDYETSASRYQAGIELAHKLEDKWAEVSGQMRLGDVRRYQGKLKEASALCKQSLKFGLEIGSLVIVTESVEKLVGVAVAECDYPRAARLTGVAQTLRDACHLPVENVDEMEHERCIAEARKNLGKEAFAAAWAEAHAWSKKEAIAYALQES